MSKLKYLFIIIFFSQAHLAHPDIQQKDTTSNGRIDIRDLSNYLKNNETSVTNNNVSNNTGRDLFEYLDTQSTDTPIQQGVSPVSANLYIYDPASGVDIRSLTRKSLATTESATGDANLYNYTPSRYDRGGTMPYELRNLDAIRENNMEKEKRQILLISVITLTVLLVAFHFFSKHQTKEDRRIRVETIHSNGGIAGNYQILINYFLSTPNSMISSVSKDHLTIEIEDEHSNTEFIIKPDINQSVTIQWILNVKPMGNYSMDWNFNEESSTQAQMLEKVILDVEEKSREIVIPKFSK